MTWDDDMQDDDTRSSQSPPADRRGPHRYAVRARERARARQVRERWERGIPTECLLVMMLGLVVRTDRFGQCATYLDDVPFAEVLARVDAPPRFHSQAEGMRIANRWYAAADEIARERRPDRFP